MKRTFLKFFMVSMLAGITGTSVMAQQQTIVNLILTGFNEAHRGFPSFMNDTVSDFGGWDYKINPSVVKQFANVQDIKLDFKKNYKSLLMNDTLVQLNLMRIKSETTKLGENKTWDDYKDTLTSYYNKIVEFYKQAFGSQLNYTQVIPLDDPEDADFKPRYCIYFYEKTITLPDTLISRYDIEKQLDVIAWFSIELQENPLIADYYNMIYRISGGQRQKDIQ